MICPVCESTLQRRFHGLICNNIKCPLNYKNNKGWMLYDRKREESAIYFKAERDNDITKDYNRKYWLYLKVYMIHLRGKCEKCATDRKLEIHHILTKSKYPELAVDMENLQVLCNSCHDEIHKNDRYRYPRN